MKKLLLITLSILLLSGCEDYLNVDYSGKSTTATFFSEYSGLENAGQGLHRTMLSFYDDNVLFYEMLRSDQLNVTSSASDQYGPLFNYTLTPNDDFMSRTYYNNGYVVITNANNILTYAPDLKKTELSHLADIDRIMGYAYFARALAHFQICNAYAQPYNYTADASHLGICVMDHIPGFNDDLPRNTVKEVYDLVIKDLKAGIELLGDDSIPNQYYASGIACEALLARVYLYMEDWDNAETYSAKVMSKIPLSPYSEYENLFRGGPDVKGTETIFRLNSYGTGTVGVQYYCSPMSKYQIYPDPAMTSNYVDDDIRLKMLTYVCTDDDPAAYHGLSFPAILKYCIYPSITDQYKRWVCPIVLRSSEMYLIHAEALTNKTNPDLAGAAADIKALEARARNKSVDNISLSYSNASDMNDIIEKERIKELDFEGHRFFDIIRRKKDLVRSSTSNSSIKKITYPDYRFVLPINFREILANEAMEQNEGYTN